MMALNFPTVVVVIPLIANKSSLLLSTCWVAVQQQRVSIVYADLVHLFSQKKRMMTFLQWRLQGADCSSSIDWYPASGVDHPYDVRIFIQSQADMFLSSKSRDCPMSKIDDTIGYPNELWFQKRYTPVGGLQTPLKLNRRGVIVLSWQIEFLVVHGTRAGKLTWWRHETVMLVKNTYQYFFSLSGMLGLSWVYVYGVPLLKCFVNLSSNDSKPVFDQREKLKKLLVKSSSPNKYKNLTVIREDFSLTNQNDVTTLNIILLLVAYSFLLCIKIPQSLLVQTFNIILNYPCMFLVKSVFLPRDVFHKTT